VYPRSQVPAAHGRVHASLQTQGQWKSLPCSVSVPALSPPTFHLINGILLVMLIVQEWNWLGGALRTIDTIEQ